MARPCPEFTGPGSPSTTPTSAQRRACPLGPPTQPDTPPPSLTPHHPLGLFLEPLALRPPSTASLGLLALHTLGATSCGTSPPPACQSSRTRGSTLQPGRGPEAVALTSLQPPAHRPPWSPLPPDARSSGQGGTARLPDPRQQYAGPWRRLPTPGTAQDAHLLLPTGTKAQLLRSSASGRHPVSPLHLTHFRLSKPRDPHPEKNQLIVHSAKTEQDRAPGHRPLTRLSESCRSGGLTIVGRCLPVEAA